MQERTGTFYKAVPAEEQAYDSSQGTTRTTEATQTFPAPNQPQPHRVESPWLQRAFRLLFDLLVALVALLFAVFGILVYKYDGHPADPGSTALKLHEIAQYAPTIFPVLFAAIAGGSIKSIATWRIQTHHGATVRLVEQCLGSQTMSRAFTTQLKLRALNFFGFFLILLWALSPLGSQGSLRIISIVPSSPSTLTTLNAMNTSLQYQRGNSEGMSEATTTVASPLIASLLAASLLSGRNQDLWQNIRFPVIEQLENNGDYNWMKAPENNNLTYASLVGTPVAELPSLGNTSFMLPGSYLSLSCPNFGPLHQTTFTNFTNSTAPSPNNGYDCGWASANAQNQFQIAMSMPCDESKRMYFGATTRNARKLVWQSIADDSFNTVKTQAECELTTTFVDVNVTCVGSTCNPTAVRRSPTPSFNGNWTAFDMTPSNMDVGAVMTLLTTLFPNSGISGSIEPIITYLTNPYHAVGDFGGSSYDVPPYTIISSSTFAIRLGQLLNSILYLGISPPDFTGSFNKSTSIKEDIGGTTITAPTINLTATTTTLQDTVRCNMAWFVVLEVAALAGFFVALFGAYLRVVNLAPDILGSISVAFLKNEIGDVSGSSTWSSDTWARHLKDVKLYLGDVQPGDQIGRIALSTSGQVGSVSSVQNRRSYI